MITGCSVACSAGDGRKRGRKVARAGILRCGAIKMMMGMSAAAFGLLLLLRCSQDDLQPRVKLDVLYSVAHSVTYMTDSLLKVASFSLTPSSLKSLFPPPPFIPPMRWAPGLLFHAPRHRSFGSAAPSNGHFRRRASSKPLTAVHSPPHTSQLSGDDVVGGLS